MEGRRLILNDGTEIEDGEAGYSEGALWCWFREYTMAEASAIFFDKEKTKVIRFQYGEDEDRYEGFTECRRLMEDEDGKISVCMTKEVNTDG